MPHHNLPTNFILLGHRKSLVIANTIYYALCIQCSCGCWVWVHWQSELIYIKYQEIGLCDIGKAEIITLKCISVSSELPLSLLV